MIKLYRNIIRFLALIFSVNIIVLALCSCGTINFSYQKFFVVEPDYVRHASIENKSIVTFYGDGYIIKTKNAEYFFEDSIEINTSKEFVNNSEKVLEKINYKAQKIYIMKDYSPALFYGNIYSNIDMNKTVGYIALLLLAKFNTFGNYGLAYALANDYCKYLKWDCENTKLIDLPNESIAYDLSVLNFSLQYSTEEEVQVAKKASLNFFEYLKTYQSIAQIENLLSDTISFKVKLSQFYNSTNISHTLTEIEYGFGGKTYDFSAKTELATFFINKSYINFYITEIIDEYFLHNNYKSTNLYLCQVLSDMKDLQKIIGLENYRNDLLVFYKNFEDYSQYDSSGHMIMIIDIFTFSHEYVHSLTIPNVIFLDKWVIEGIALFIGEGFGVYEQDVLQFVFEVVSEQNVNYFKELLAFLDRNIDFSRDRRTIYDYYTYKENYTINTHYGAYSFLLYLSDTLTYSQVKEALVSKTGEFEPLPKTIEQYVAEWNAYIKNKFKNIDKN